MILLEFSVYPSAVRIVFLWGALLSIGVSANAEKTAAELAAGHSVHGEVFNEGPRQAAVLIPGTGDVHLKVSTGSETAQKFFDQGIGQLHGFWDFEAERSFRQVAKLDPDCAMAYWGMAMANFKNDERGKKFIAEAKERKEKATEFEQMWIDGLEAYFSDTKKDKKKRLREFVRSLEKIAAKFPNHVEPQAFLLKQIYFNHGNGLSINSHYATNLLAEKILQLDPDHPANHYQIHLWDRETPENALLAAANCGPAAPGIAHMWHMPGHIYARLHRYEDAAWQQEASARVDHAHMMRYRIVPDRIHNFAHNNEWCIRNLNALGQVERSIALAKNMISLPRLPKFNEKEEQSTYNPGGSSWQYGRQRLRDTLVNFEMWDELIVELDSHWLKPDGKAISFSDYDRWMAIAHLQSDRIEEAKVYISSLRDQLEQEKGKKDRAVSNAQLKAQSAKKDQKGVEQAGKTAEKPFTKRVTDLQNRLNEVLVYQHLLTENKDKKAALALLPNLKNVAKHRHARLWHLAGNQEKAIELAEQAVSSAKNEVVPLIHQVEILHGAGKKDKARDAFENLRKVAYFADSELPILQRLQPIAKQFEFPKDWKLKPEKSKDLGERPDLASLGPFQWSAPAAPQFALPDSKGETISLKDFSGEPVLVIFYLGRGCSHCMEQLQAFTPLYENYAQAGIKVVAVSSDTPDGLAKTLQGADNGENPFPFPLISDSTLETFRAYRAYDDFEEMTLHGSFLIGPDQKILWQDISYEPFMQADWLLVEAKRILSLQ